MKAPDFGYDRPETLEAALAALAVGGLDARLLAGGQSLMPMLNFRVASPSLLIDINRVPGLDTIKDVGGVVRIGAMVRHAVLESSEVIARHVPLIREVMPHIAHAAIRTRGTIGGSLALADPAAELPACMVALDAVIVVRSAAAKRRIAAADFFRGIYETALEANEMIVAVDIPKQTHRRHAFREMARRHGDYAMAGVVVSTAGNGPFDDPRIVFFGVADKPVRVAAAEQAVAGFALGAEAAERAAATLDGSLHPHGDLHAPAEMKLRLAKVLLRRAVADLGAAPEGSD